MSDLHFLTFIIMLISHVNDLLKAQTSCHSTHQRLINFIPVCGYGHSAFGPRRRRTKNICKDCEAWKAELGIDEVTNSERLSKVDETKQ